MADPPASTSRLGDWYVKPFPVAQRRFIMAISVPSRLPVVMQGRDVARLTKRFPDDLGRVLERLGVPADVIEAEVAASCEVIVAATDSRSVLGCLNDFAWNAQERLRFEAETDLVGLAASLAEMPVVAGDFGLPVDHVRRLLGMPPRLRLVRGGL
jgi:hypothetical protein